MIFLNSKFREALLSYLNAKELDDKTKEKYLWFFDKFANVHGELTQENIDKFLKYNKNSSPVRAMFKHLIKAIGRWDFPLETKDYIIRLDIPKVTGKKKKQAPLYMSFKELEYLSNKLPRESLIDIRNNLSIKTQWWGGLRISELLGITIDDLQQDNYNKEKDFQRMRIRPETAKFKKEGYCYIPTKLYYEVVQFIRHRSKIGNFSKKLNQGDNIWGFNKSAYSKMLRKFTLKYLGRGFNSHSLRHGRGTDLAKKNVPIEKIKEILRHEDISSTQLYVHLANKDIEDSLK